MIQSVIIIDDEKAARENLQMMIKSLSPNTIFYEAKNIMEGKSLIEKEKPQVVFLDIHLPQHSGFDLLELIDTKNFIVVVVTAHLNHSLKAIKLKVFDFLLKPFGFSTLKNTLERIDKELSENKKESIHKKLIFKTRNVTYYIDPNEIVFCKSDNNYTTVHFINKKQLLLSKSIKSLEEELRFPFFFRIHRSFIINLNYISKYNSSDGFVYLLNDTIEVPIADRKRKEFASIIQF